MASKLTFVIIICMALSLTGAGCVQSAPGTPVEQQPEPGYTPPPAIVTPDVAADDDGVTASLHFINVGKADAALVRVGKSYYLIDTGTKASYPALKASLGKIGVTELEAVFITHAHDDHIGGLKKLAEDFEIGMIYGAQLALPNKSGENKTVKRANKSELPCTLLNAGDTVDGLFTVLGPVVLNEDDDNDNSLVLMFEVNGVKALFTGDMQFAEELTLLSASTPVKADILKVGNHGNPDATSDEFGAAVSPRYAVISTDTAEDADSANPRVYAALGTAEIYVTEAAADNIVMSISAGGDITPGVF